MCKRSVSWSTSTNTYNVFTWPWCPRKGVVFFPLFCFQSLFSFHSQSSLTSFMFSSMVIYKLASVCFFNILKSVECNFCIVVNLGSDRKRKKWRSGRDPLTMRVRRGSSSPPLLLDNGKAEPPTSVNGSTNYYQFELEAYHVERGKRGQKVFTCDICPSGVFKRSFSLKRHYLRFHINFAFLSPRDLNNCAIAVAGQNQRSGGALLGDHGSANGTPLLYRCHQCGYLMRYRSH